MARELAFWLQSVLPQSFFLNWWVEVVLLTMVLNVFVLVLVRYITPMQKIKATWRLLTADAMAIFLYRRYPRIILGSEVAIWIRLVRICLLLAPALVTVTLLVLLLAPAAISRLSYTPAVVGQPIIIEVRRHASDLVGAATAPMADGEILTIDAMVNDPPRDRIWLRIIPIAAGIGFVQPERDGVKVPVNVGQNEQVATRLASAGDRRVEIYYELRRSAGMRHGWLWMMTILSCFLAVPMVRVIRRVKDWRDCREWV